MNKERIINTVTKFMEDMKDYIIDDVKFYLHHKLDFKMYLFIDKETYEVKERQTVVMGSMSHSNYYTVEILRFNEDVYKIMLDFFSKEEGVSWEEWIDIQQDELFEKFVTFNPDDIN